MHTRFTFTSTCVPSGLGAREYTPGLAGIFSVELHFPWKERPREENARNSAKISSELLSKGAAKPGCPWTPGLAERLG